jgi:plastocyanin
MYEFRIVSARRLLLFLACLFAIALTAVFWQTAFAKPDATATMRFGNPDAGSDFPPNPPHDRSANAEDNIIPRTVVISEGGTVEFLRESGRHQVAIYEPGTAPEDIDTSILVPGDFIADPTNRVAGSLSPLPSAPGWSSFTSPPLNDGGKYLVICTFLPHFEIGMYGWIEVKELD